MMSSTVCLEFVCVCVEVRVLSMYDVITPHCNSDNLCTNLFRLLVLFCSGINIHYSLSLKYGLFKASFLVESMLQLGREEEL